MMVPTNTRPGTERSAPAMTIKPPVVAIQRDGQQSFPLARLA